MFHHWNNIFFIYTQKLSSTFKYRHFLQALYELKSNERWPRYLRLCAATLQDIVNHDSPKHPIACVS